jgi:hypothetical protein
LASPGENAYYPKSQPARPGKPYPYVLSSCDLGDFVDFDGSFWHPIGDITGTGLPARNAVPAQWKGTLTLVGHDRAAFKGRTKGSWTFRRKEGPSYAASKSCI